MIVTNMTGYGVAAWREEVRQHYPSAAFMPVVGSRKVLATVKSDVTPTVPIVVASHDGPMHSTLYHGNKP